MKQLAVSIIIPTYNAAHFISHCIESCLKQTYSNIEILVINDGSKDDTHDIVEALTLKDSRVKLINKRNEGVNLARKTGIEAATGNYLFFLDADDTIPKNAIEVLYKQSLYNNNIDIIAGDVKIFKNKVFTQQRLYSEFKTGTGDQFLEFILKNQLHYLWGKLIKRSVYTENTISTNKNLKVGEDQVQMYQLCMFVNTVSTTNTVVYNYILNENSVTQKPTNNNTNTKNWEAYAIALHELLQRFEYSIFTKQQIRLRILWALFGAIGTSKQFVYKPKKSSKILRLTIFKSIFSKHSLIFKYYKILIKAFVYPFIYKFSNYSK